MQNPPRQTYEPTTVAEERINALTHAPGVLAGLAILILLVNHGLQYNNIQYILAVSIYGATFTWTYITSTLYHGFFRVGVKTRNFLHLLDHTAIYLFIAGTYTPVALFALPPGWDVGILTGIWGLAFVGVLSKIFAMGRFKLLSLIFYLLMGWMIIVALKPLISYAPMPLLYWLLAGGICYSIGTVFFSLRNLKYHHGIWHLFVLAGSLCHFAGIYFYLEV